MNVRRWALVSLGTAIIVGVLLAPTGWYDALPGIATVPQASVRGIVLLQATIVLEGFALLWLGVRPARREFHPSQPEGPEYQGFVGTWDVGSRPAGLALVIITGLALGLRLLTINSDLWLDELATIIPYRGVSPVAVLLTYTSPNNHLLNTLLVKLMISIAGEREWAVRLPAVLFGVATIPAVYWVARSVLTRLGSLGAALLLAVSYHHIFFSQNARGYSSYLLFSLLSIGFLVRALEDDRAQWWTGYVVATLFDFASLLHGGFVFAGHVLVGAAWVMNAKRTRRPTTPGLRRLTTVFGLTAFLGLQLYVTVVMQARAVLSHMYAKPASGMAITSHAFAADFLRGLLEGINPALLAGAIPAAGIAAYGLVVLIRRKWTLAGALVLPLALLAGLVAFRSLSASPRFFLLALPLADICAVLGVFSLAERVGRGMQSVRSPWAIPAVAAGVIAVVAGASAASLPAYYRTPKQSYREAVAYLRATVSSRDLIVPIQNADGGLSFYGSDLLDRGMMTAVRTAGALDSLQAGHRNLVLVTTLERGLELEEPELFKQIHAGWVPVREFSGTIHDGEIRIWRSIH